MTTSTLSFLEEVPRLTFAGMQIVIKSFVLSAPGALSGERRHFDETGVHVSELPEVNTYLEQGYTIQSIHMSESAVSGHTKGVIVLAPPVRYLAGGVF